MSTSEPTDGWWEKVLTGPQGNLSDPGSSEKYIVLPNQSSPRIVVDRDEPQAIQDVTDRLIQNRTDNGAVKGLLSKAAPMVISRRKKDMWSVSSGTLDHTLRQHLCELLDTDLRISISVGPPRPNRKPVVRCYRDDGMFAVAKLGPDPHTAEMVQNEGRWLDVMAAQPLAGVATPPLLHLGKYGNSALLVMGALDLTSDLGVDFAEVPVATAAEFATRFAEGEPMEQSTWWHRLPVRMDDAALDSVQALMSQLRKAPLFNAVQTAGWHGDWSPWNMGVSPTGKFCIWDWERATIGVPLGMDVVHLHYQYGDGLDAADDDLRAMGVPSEHHNIVKRMYLFELCARHCEADALKSERHVKVVDTLAALSTS